MQVNAIFKNKVILLSILLSLSLHISIFFILGRLISLKEDNSAKFSKTKTIEVTFSNLELNNPIQNTKKKDIKREKTTRHSINKESIQKTAAKEKNLNIKAAESPEKISKVTLNEAPVDIVKKKMTKIERLESSLNINNRKELEKKELTGEKHIEHSALNYSKKNSYIKLVLPDYRLNKKPIYPRAARIRGYQGTVFLKIDLNAEGKVVKSLIEKSSGYSILDKAALKASYGWHFKPAYLNGIAIPSTILVPVTFKLSEDS